MTEDIYQEALVAEAQSPQNSGLLADHDLEHHETNASCGDEVTISLKFSEDGQRVDQVGWEGQGCTVSQASMSVLSEKLIGASLDEIKKWQKADLLPFFGLKDISAGRKKCFMMGLEVVQKALG
ncbi:MAG TPA: iron-sulfur cluster assembly scaffold protein [Patescibacteria group bacterium]|jgi:nitrogen fixation NifU-like protein